MVIHSVLLEVYTSVAGLDSSFFLSFFLSFSIYLFSGGLCTPTVLCKLLGVDAYGPSPII